MRITGDGEDRRSEMERCLELTKMEMEDQLMMKLIRNSRQACIEKEMNRQNCDFYVESQTFYNHLKTKTKSLYIYTSSVLKDMTKHFDKESYGYGIFSEDGYLLKLYGGEKFSRWCEEIGIKTGSLWSEETIGTNAVAIGLKYKRYMETVGEEHFCWRLKDTACYFQPIMTKYAQSGSWGDMVHGGLAIFCPTESKNSAFRSLVAAVANEVSLQFLWFENCSSYLDAFDGYGYIFLDKSLGKNSIIAAGNNTFKILKTKRPDYYEDLTAIIPEEKNHHFWEIINKRIECSDRLVELWVNEKGVKVNLSTMNFKDERFHMDGTLIALNSIKRINKLISSYVGLNARFSFDNIIGKSSNILNAIGYAEIASRSDSNILLLGESGTGKDVFAQAIHNNSSRKNSPFVALNCAAFSKELISSELFGYEDGAFTGAKRGGSVGKFELANHGTIFLDEIGDMSLDLQATLLRVIEERSFMKLGGNNLTSVDVRIIAATNVNLLERVKNKQFREDLFYRLGIVRINIPPLRERREDIPLLTKHFIRSICQRVNKPEITMSEEIEKFFMSYDWPGNVRELQNLLEGMINMHDTYRNEVIELDFVKRYLGVYEDAQMTRRSEEISESKETDEMLKALPHSKEKMIEALKECKNNRSKAAERLGISRSTMYRKMKEYGLL